jgi:UDP-N-acetylmuramoylalanine-D-glutamate ligase
MFTDLESAILSAQKRAKKGENILISPAAGFFYSDFVKGKKSLRRIVEDLPQS